jgi:hypothetical protein
MADQTQVPPVGQPQPAGPNPGRPDGTAPVNQPAPQGLMGMAHVQPSGTAYRSYDPVAKGEKR